jgi:hypothetical protein
VKAQLKPTARPKSSGEFFLDGVAKIYVVQITRANFSSTRNTNIGNSTNCLPLLARAVNFALMCWMNRILIDQSLRED